MKLNKILAHQNHVYKAHKQDLLNTNSVNPKFEFNQDFLKL